MGKNKTSASFYRRGIPNNYYSFGAAALGNYSIVQPQSLFLMSTRPRIPIPVPPIPIFGLPTVMFPLLYGSNDGGYTQNNPGPYNTIINNKYYLNLPANVTLYNGEYNTYQEYRYNFGTAKVTVNVDAIQNGTTVQIFRKAFTSNYGFVGQYYLLQSLTNGINNFTVNSINGISNVAIEQLGIIIKSPSTGNCTCNVLGVNISFS